MKKLIYLWLSFLCALLSAGSAHAQNINDHLINGKAIDDLSLNEVKEFLLEPTNSRDSIRSNQCDNLIRKYWSKSINEPTSGLDKLVILINYFAITQHKYDLIIDLFQNVLDEPNPNKIEDRLLAYKSFAVALNKLGHFQHSVRVLNHGLEKAKQIQNDPLICDYYHHLNHEYRYLSLIDSSLKVEFNRINRKCIEYNQKLSRTALVYANILDDQVPHWDEKTCSKMIDSFLGDYKKSDLNENIQNIHLLETYVLNVFQKGYYQESIKSLHKYNDLISDIRLSLQSTIISRSFLELSQKDSAIYYANAALEHYQNIDQDEKRFVLCFLPSILSEVGLHKEATKLEKERYYSLQKQFLYEPVGDVEQYRLKKELVEAQNSQKQSQATNQFLIFCICASVSIIPIFVLSDIQIRKRNRIIKKTAQQLLYSYEYLKSANDDLESYAYASAHDIRNPLRSISSILNLISSDNFNKVSNQSKNYIDKIYTQVDIVQNYIQGLLDYALINKHNINTTQIVDVNLLLNEIEHSIGVDYPDSHFLIFRAETLPPIHGDPSLVHSLFYELLSNAVKFKSSGTSASIHLLHRIKKNKLRIEIIDDGLGIPEKDLNKVYDLFYRARNAESYPGVGVGLALAKKITNLHEWKLSLKNNENRGITVAITLPLMKKYPVQS